MKFLLVEVDKRGVATLTLNRPELHNAFNDLMIEELIQVFNDFAEDQRIRLIVLTGTGKSFCAGADLHWMKKMKDYSEEENFKDAQKLSLLFRTINEVTLPVIARVNGAAFGGGVGLLSVCDYVLASESAQMGLSEVLLGLLPAVISPFVLSKIGNSFGRVYFLSGEKFSALRAKEMGLVHEVCVESELDARTEFIIKNWLRPGPQAQREVKKLLNALRRRQEGESLERVEDLTCRAISRVRISTEGQEGMTALLEKRAPNWISPETNSTGEKS